MNRNRPGVVISCEHATNHVPVDWKRFFKGRQAQAALKSHLGWDPGALTIAEALAGLCGTAVRRGAVSRLLVDLNRSPTNRTRFSAFVPIEAVAERATLTAQFYDPYRRQVRKAISTAIGRRGAVIHISVHTFTPVLRGAARHADVGLLYDPKRARETAFCARWMSRLQMALPTIEVRRNYPYRGTADGFTKTLRAAFDESEYLGIELEVNQRFPLRQRTMFERLVQELAVTLRSVVDEVAAERPAHRTATARPRNVRKLPIGAPIAAHFDHAPGDPASNRHPP